MQYAAEPYLDESLPRKQFLYCELFKMLLHATIEIELSNEKGQP